MTDYAEKLAEALRKCQEACRDNLRKYQYKNESILLEAYQSALRAELEQKNHALELVSPAVDERDQLRTDLEKAEGLLRDIGTHSKSCPAYRTIGRFGSASGLTWNQTTDPETCRCPLGAFLNRNAPKEKSE